MSALGKYVMTSPRRIFSIYAYLYDHAEEVRDFMIAAGDKVSGTVQMMLAKDRAKLLHRWGEEMDEICGVLDGSHKDPYILEATQCFYWASLFTVTGGYGWDDINLYQLRRDLDKAAIEDPAALNVAVKRLVELGADDPDKVKPQKLFFMWLIADRIYRVITPRDKQWSIDQIMDADLADMKKRPYLIPVLKAVPEDL
jgi:hypothetical protein